VSAGIACLAASAMSLMIGRRPGPEGVTLPVAG
jgi:hypothetical protein